MEESMVAFKELIDNEDVSLRAVSDEISAIKMKLDVAQNCCKEYMQSRNNDTSTPNVSGSGTKHHHCHDDVNRSGYRTRQHIFLDDNNASMSSSSLASIDSDNDDSI